MYIYIYIYIVVCKVNASTFLRESRVACSPFLVADHNVLVDRPEKPPSLSEAAEGTYPENYYKEVADEVLPLVA